VSGETPEFEENLTIVERAGIKLAGKGEEVWMRPSYDGQRVFVAPDGSVRFGDPADEL
jgi:hypothetical protein